MGVVYKAQDSILGRVVAIKELIVNKDISEKAKNDLTTRFYREAKAAGSLSHPNIVTVFDYGETPTGEHYMVMEFLQGRSLERVLRDDGPQSWDKIVKWLEQIASALDYAHQNGVVHRDIKPANILIDDNDVVKIADFGIARLSNATAVTQDGALLGTILYMSPEQVKGSLDLDGRSDIFSLGSTLYEILTGKPPFVGTSAGDTIFKIMTQEVEPPSKIITTVPHVADIVLLKALAKNVSDRYQTVTEMYDDIFVEEREQGGVTVGSSVGNIFCSKCGKHVPPNVNFCLNCNAPVFVVEKNDPHSYDDHMNFADMHYANGRIKEALSEYQKAVAKNPKNVIGLYYLALTYEELNMIPSAINVYQQLLKIGNPNEDTVKDAKANLDKLLAAIPTTKIMEDEDNNKTVYEKKKD